MAMRWGVAQGLAAWLGVSAVGVGILVAPDRGDRLISLSADHGPSVQDGIGVVFLAIGWAAFLIPLYGARRQLRVRWPLVAGGAGGGLLTGWSVATDNGTWWLLGVAVMIVVQLAAGLAAIRAQRLTQDPHPYSDGDERVEP